MDFFFLLNSRFNIFPIYLFIETIGFWIKTLTCRRNGVYIEQYSNSNFIILSNKLTVGITCFRDFFFNRRIFNNIEYCTIFLKKKKIHGCSYKY
jgi:hypothetical protein